MTERGTVAHAVTPGWIHTEMVDEFARTATSESLKRVNPLGRMGKPDEVARLVEYLAVDAPAYLTGSTLYVDGGQTAMALLPGCGAATALAWLVQRVLRHRIRTARGSGRWDPRTGTVR